MTYSYSIFGDHYLKKMQKCAVPQYNIFKSLFVSLYRNDNSITNSN